LLDYLEVKLELMEENGKLSKIQLEELESLIEKRKTAIENQVHLLNPKAIELLHSRLEIVENHLKGTHPKEFQHIKQLKELFNSKIKKQD